MTEHIQLAMEFWLAFLAILLILAIFTEGIGPWIEEWWRNR